MSLLFPLGIILVGVEFKLGSKLFRNGVMALIAVYFYHNYDYTFLNNPERFVPNEAQKA